MRIHEEGIHFSTIAFIEIYSLTFLLIGLFEGSTLKNESSRPWVEDFLAFSIFLAPFRILSSLKSRLPTCIINNLTTLQYEVNSDN